MYNKPYLSIQELVEKTSAPRKTIEETMDSTAAYHPEEASLIEGLKAQDRFEVQEAIHNIPLREFLAKSGTTGIAGAAYLVPAKVHDDLINYVGESDIAPLIGEMVNGWEGGDLLVDIIDKSSYKAMEYTSGAQFATKTLAVKQATLSPVGFNISPRITTDLVEDAAVDIISFHLKAAAQAMATKSNNLVLTVLGTGTDGWGTINSGNASADQTKWTEVTGAIAANTDDHWITNTIIATQEAWEHSIMNEIGLEFVGGAAGDAWTTHPYNYASSTPVAAGFTFKTLNIDWKLLNNDAMHLANEDGAMTNCVTYLFDRNNAILTGRKKWMQITNYADPVRDLAGMVITARQDSVTLQNDCIYKLTET
jgi:hypothetical protein